MPGDYRLIAELATPDFGGLGVHGQIVVDNHAVVIASRVNRHFFVLDVPLNGLRRPIERLPPATAPRLPMVENVAFLQRARNHDGKDFLVFLPAQNG